MQKKMNFLKNKLYQGDLESISQYINIKRDMSILVTGASGLIGSLVVDALLYFNENNDKKHSFKIFAMARNEERLNKRFCNFVNSSNLTLFTGDICEPLPDEFAFDYIIHTASNADPGTYSVYPAETIKTNVMGTLQVLEYAKKHKGTKVLFTSTMEVYGEIPGKNSFGEQDFGSINLNSVRSGYPESKRVSELLCRSYADEYGVDAIIVRLGYIYGPTMTETDNKVVAQFIRNGLNKENIFLKSKGEQKRSYCYGADAVAGMFCVLFRGTKAEAYNIANEHSIVTIADMAQIMADIARTSVIYSEPERMELKGFSAPQDAVLEVEKLKSLGWKAKYDLIDGFKRTLTILGAEIY